VIADATSYDSCAIIVVLLDNFAVDE